MFSVLQTAKVVCISVFRENSEMIFSSNFYQIFILLQDKMFLGVSFKT